MTRIRTMCQDTSDRAASGKETKDSVNDLVGKINNSGVTKAKDSDLTHLRRAHVPGSLLALKTANLTLVDASAEAAPTYHRDGPCSSLGIETLVSELAGLLDDGRPEEVSRLLC